VHCARIAIEGQIVSTGHPWANVFHVYLPGEVATVADWITYIQSFANVYETRFFPYLVTDVKTTLCRGSLRQGTSSVLTLETGRNLAGSVAVSIVDSAASALVSWLTLSAYRGGHARTYLPGVPSSAMANAGLIGAVFRGNIATAAAGFLSDVNALVSTNIPVSELGVVHFQRANAWLSPTTFEPMLGVTVRNYLRSQRRRMEP